MSNVFTPTMWPAGFLSQAGVDNPVNLEGLEPNPQSSLSGYRVFNNTAGPVYLALDTPATLAGIPVAAGALWSDDTRVSVLHIYTPSAVPINGGTPGGAAPLGASGNSVTVWGVV